MIGEVIGDIACRFAQSLGACEKKSWERPTVNFKRAVGDGAFMYMIRSHMKEMSNDVKFAYIVRFLWRSQYGWGREIISDVDCSGSVCFALYLMGYNIRTTAHGIYTHLCSDESVKNPRAGDLQFWWHETENRIRHVAVYSDNGVIMNASTLFEDRLGAQEIYSRDKAGQRPEKRRLDWDKVQAASTSGNHVYGLDTELKPLFNIFGGSE